MADRYLITGGGTVNWNDVNSWSASDGGATGASFPVAGDRVFLTALSGAGQLTVNVASACADFDVGAYTGTVAGVSQLSLSSSVLIGAGVTWSHTGTVQLVTTAGTSKTITANGKTFGGALTINPGAGATMQLADDVACAGVLTYSGSAGAVLDLNGHTLMPLTTTATGATVRTLTSTVAGGKIKLTSTAAAIVWQSSGAGLVMGNRDKWSIEVSGNTTNAQSVQSGGRSMPSVVWTNTTPNGRLNFVGAQPNTFRALSYTGGVAQTVTLPAGPTQSIENDDGFFSGSDGALISVSGGAVSKVGGGTVSCSFLSLTGVAAVETDTWFAHSSVDNGGNTNWIFDEPEAIDEDTLLWVKQKRVHEQRQARADEELVVIAAALATMIEETEAECLQ